MDLRIQFKGAYQFDRVKAREMFANGEIAYGK
jgi:hypothetical protein